MATDQNDPELDEIQERVDQIRGRLADNPGLDVVDKRDVPAYYDDSDVPEEGISKEEIDRRDDAG